MSFARPGALPPEQAPDPGWSQSLSSGAAGLALLHIGYAHAGLTDWACAHQWVQAMTSHPVAAHPSACLFQGAPAVAFVLRTAALPAYTPVLHALDEHVTAITRARLVAAHERIDLGELPALREFDLINGLTGLGAYLLQALRTGPRHHNGELLREVLAYLIRLTGPITVEDTVLPGWWTENGPSDRPDSRWPGGHANLGLAHGIAGPWALLSAAMISGLTVPGHTEAIEHITRFFSTWSGGWPATPWWPGLLSAREWGNGVLDQPGPQQPSWCYGTPGVLHAHHLAAQALNLPARAAWARTALASCITDPAQLQQLGDDSLCHGWAGLVHLARRMLTAADGELADALARLEHRWRDQPRQGPNSDGMLEGQVGIALTTLPLNSSWDACLLTAPPTTRQADTPAATPPTEGTA